MKTRCCRYSHGTTETVVRGFWRNEACRLIWYWRHIVSSLLFCLSAHRLLSVSVRHLPPSTLRDANVTNCSSTGTTNFHIHINAQYLWVSWRRRILLNGDLPYVYATHNIIRVVESNGVRGGVVCWSTALQAGRSQVWSPVAWSRLSCWHKWVLGISPGVKVAGAKSSLPWRFHVSVVRNFRAPQAPAALRDSPGLCRKSC